MNILVALLPAIVAAGAIAVLLSSPLASRFLDRPGDRSLHARVTPRVGGLGLMTAALPAVLFHGTPAIQAVAAAAAVVFAVSAFDDFRSLPVAVRLPCHFAASAAAVGVAWPGSFPGVAPAADVAIAVVAVLAIAWMTNAFNFMDGADGLAGCMALVGFAAFAFAAFAGGNSSLAYSCLALSAAAAGFLAFNFPPARVFMGDSGSVPLGFLAGAFGWLGFTLALWPWWFPALVFSPFLIDATVTLARRMAGREPLLQAHRSHYYQRLVLGGWSHRRLAAAAWVLMAAVAASAIAALGLRGEVQGAIISFWAIAYGVILLSIDRRYPREQK